jgi:hypothetical protein
MRISRGSVQPFYRHTGKGRWSWARHNGGMCSRDKVATWSRRRRRVVARPSGIDGPVACTRRVWVDSGQGRAIWSLAGRGLLGRCSLARLAGVGMPRRVAVHLYWPEQSRGRERRKREGERKGLGFKLNFLKLSNRNLKNFEHESCRKFENLQQLF